LHARTHARALHGRKRACKRRVLYGSPQCTRMHALCVHACMHAGPGGDRQSTASQQTQVSAHTGPEELAGALKGAELVIIPAGVPRKPGMTRDDLFNVNAGACRRVGRAGGLRAVLLHTRSQSTGSCSPHELQGIRQRQGTSTHNTHTRRHRARADRGRGQGMPDRECFALAS